MTTRRPRPLLLLTALALAAATALVWSDVAAAQQSEPPTELWQEYPLDPERGSPEPGSGSSQSSDSRNDRAPVGDDDGGAAAATDEARFPLLPILVTLGVLLLVLIPGVGIWAQGHRGPERLRNRIGAVRFPSLLDRPRLVHAALRLRRGFLDHGLGPGHPRRPAARPAEEEPERRPKTASGPAKPREPKTRAPAQKKPAAQKAQPAKPPHPAKPPKAARSAKPVRRAEGGASPGTKKPVSAPRPKPKPRTRKKARAKKAPERAQPRLVAAETLAERKLTCSIFGWRDGPLADFYALASGLQGHEWVVERSPKFEWPAGDFPAAGREAHAMLVDALVQEGWRQVGSEGVWYRQCFERPFEGGGREGSER